jgi:CRISPR-associated protein Csb1
MSLTESLRSAIAAGDAVIRIHADLRPVSGDKILPPTYAGAVHNMTPPREDGSSAWCSVDSPASFANRIEAVLVAAHPELAPLRVQAGSRLISTLEMPHRAFDATLRESTLDGVKWEQTEIAKAISRASQRNADALLRFDPALLLLGGWDLTKLGKRAQATREAKYPAALSCEITATDVIPVERAGSRIDPLGIEGTQASLVEHEDGTLEPYSDAQHGNLPIRGERDNDDYPRRVKPSQVNLGNVAPSLNPKGVLVRGAIALDGVIDLRRLARYQFENANAVEARLLLALMGLYGVDTVVRRGLDLRRDCELLATNLSVGLARFAAEPEALDLTDVADALATQIAAMRKHIAEPVVLEANAALRSLIGAA